MHWIIEHSAYVSSSTAFSIRFPFQPLIQSEAEHLLENTGVH